MSALPTPEESRTSTLSADFRTSIQMMMAEWYGSLEARTTPGDSLSTLLSGMSLLWTMIDIGVRPAQVSAMTMDSLGLGDGNVDLVELSSRLTKKVVEDVLIEFRAYLASR